MKIAVCDDEKIYRDTILEYLKEYGTPENDLKIQEFSDGESLVEVYQNEEFFDLIFLDVEMDGLTGVETGARIRELDANVLIIFVTSHGKYVPDAFRVGAFQFLVKPVKQEDFVKEMERALEVIRKNKQLYHVKSKELEAYVEIGDIMYIEVYNKQLEIHTINETYKMNGRIREEWERLKEYGFIQCHKSYIVNLRFVKGMEQNDLKLKNGQEVPIGRSMREEVLRQLNLYFRRRAL